MFRISSINSFPGIQTVLLATFYAIANSLRGVNDFDIVEYWRLRYRLFIFNHDFLTRQIRYNYMLVEVILCTLK